MIKKFLKKILGGKSGADVAVAAAPVAPAGPATGQRVEVGRDVHRIDPRRVDERAVRVVTTLQDAGYEAYIVGGAVRDLLLGHRPKDFDVATNATPAQVKSLFRRAFIIGRRFQLVHVVFGRGREHEGEVIEVSTFRAYLDPAAAEQIAGNEKTGRSELAGKSHVVDASGRVLRDNVWGPQDEDAARRDFTVNALYYDPRRELVIDYHQGIADAQRRILRMIGDPATRYREDPVRIIRIVRFAAKLGFEIDPATRQPIQKMADLLANVPVSRMFDEMIKLLQTGHSLASLKELRKQGLHRGIFPLLDAVLEDAGYDSRADSEAATPAGARARFIELALADTDRRVAEGKPVAPSFMLASMLWHEVLKRRDALRAQGEPAGAAFGQALDQVFDARIGDISGRGKLAADMREIWTMQPRFERRTPASTPGLAAQPRFRAGFDFLRLRAEAGEVDMALARWWEDYSLADEAGRAVLLEAVRGSSSAGRRAAGSRGAGARASTSARSGEAVEVDLDIGDTPIDEAGRDDAASGEVAAAPARKRRRRRRPAGGGGDSRGDGGAGVDGGSGGAA